MNLLTANVLAGTCVAVLGEEPSVSLSERELRFMAMENRFARRLLGAAVANALKTAREFRQDRFTRVIMPSKVNANPKVACVLCSSLTQLISKNAAAWKAATGSIGKSALRCWKPTA